MGITNVAKLNTCKIMFAVSFRPYQVEYSNCNPVFIGRNPFLRLATFVLFLLFLVSEILRLPKPCGFIME